MSLPACSYFVGLRAHHGHQPVELQVGLRRRVVAAGEQGEQDDDDDGAMTDWTIDAMCGLLNLWWVRPSADGSSPSRPSE
jgi:hypothetical protein